MYNPLVNVIHHDARMERRPSFERQFREQGIKYIVWDAVRGHTPMSVNISKAHKQIVQWAKDCNLPEVVIAEDDIQFHATDAWRYYLNNKPGDFDLYVGGIYNGVIKDDKTVERFTGMHLYTVNSKFYDTFLSVNENIDIDQSLAHLGKYVVCYPQAATQLLGAWHSDNINKVVNYNLLLKKYEIYGLDPKKLDENV